MSQPTMTPPGWPIARPYGWFRFQLASKTWPVRQFTPVYWTTMNWPDWTFGPVPWISVLVVMPFGGLFFGIVIVGCAVVVSLTVGRPDPAWVCLPEIDALPGNVPITSITNTSVSVPLMPP